MISYGCRGKDGVFAYRRQEGKEELEFQPSRAPPAPRVHTDTVTVVSFPHSSTSGFCIYYVGLSKAGREEAREIQVMKKGEVDLL